MRARLLIPTLEPVDTIRTAVAGETGLLVADADTFFRAIPHESEIEAGTLEELLTHLPQRPGPLIAASDAAFGTRPVVRVGSDEALRATLESLYAAHTVPAAILFDASRPSVSPHAFVRSIFLRQHDALYRTIPILATSYDAPRPLAGDPIRVLAVNGSPRKEGDTKRLLREEIERYWTGPSYTSAIVDLKHLVECLACGGHQKECVPDCVVKDQMRDLLPRVQVCDVLLVGSPVYMDLPTSRTIAFLSRLTGQTKFNRRAYVDKYASALSPAWCSGTKAVIGALTNALEMMGFTIQGRSTREYAALWIDGKTRGGVPHDYSWPA